jgi:hypothetical protein
MRAEDKKGVYHGAHSRSNVCVRVWAVENPDVNPIFKENKFRNKERVKNRWISILRPESGVLNK